jgi:uroporphyrinogen decarboxylase
MGPEDACTLFYDDPELLMDMLEWLQWENRTYYFPVIERLKPEIIVVSEDICYNHGLFFSPEQFRKYCMPAYYEIGDFARRNGVAMVAVDTDGFAEKLVPMLEECGVNTLFPWEVKSGNDLFRVRKNHPEFILMGGLEKEVVNEGNENLIVPEIISKVPELLKYGRYLPNGDHGIQPLVTFKSLCRFMTLLHEVCGNPEGEFPRMK